MKILFLTSFQLPSHRANRTYVVKTCEAFSNFSEAVLVIDRINGDIGERYNLKNKFRIIQVNYSKRLKSLVYVWKLRSILKKEKPDVIHLRDHYLFLFVNIFKKLGLLKTPPIIIDLHWVFDFNLKARLIDRFNIPKANYYVFLNSYIAHHYIRKFKLDYRKTLSLPNGVDLDRFKVNLTKDDLRRKLNLPLDIDLIGWNGTSFREQGIDEGAFAIIKSLPFVKNKNYLMYFIGGTEKEIEEAKKLAQEFNVLDKVKFTGFVDFMILPSYFHAFDLSLLYFPWTVHYAYHMLPRKALDYATSKCPIISSSLPCLKNFFTDDMALFCEVDNLKDLASKIDYALANREEMQEKAEKAYKMIEELTWHKRSMKIMKLVNNEKYE